MANLARPAEIVLQVSASAALARFGFVVALLLAATHAHADEFEAVSGQNRIALNCEGSAAVDAACKVEVGEGGQSGSMKVRFGSKPTQYPHLLKPAIEKAIRGGRREFPPSEADIAVLRSLMVEKCLPDTEYSGDILQLCLPPDSSSAIVLFMRGVCDRCEFEPVVLRKKAAR